MARNAPNGRETHNRKIVTLQDVANAAGVTSMTVSKVIKGKGSISVATREKVLRVVEELNYTANPAARTLATGRTGIIALICGDVGQPYYASIVSLLQAQLLRSGYEIRLLHTESELRDLLNATKTWSVDGVIVSGVHDLSEKPEFLNSELSQHCVFLDTFEHPNTDYVRIDLREAITEAIDRMIALGRQRIAYVGVSDVTNFDPSWAVEDRLRTYLSAMQKANRSYEFINSHPNPEKMTRGERAHVLKEYFHNHGCPDGLVCLHGEIAMLAFRALRENGCRVPEDVLLVGCDDVPFMDCFDPSLSAVAHPLEEVCALAWQFLQARIEDASIPLQQKTCKAKLIERESLQLT